MKLCAQTTQALSSCPQLRAELAALAANPGATDDHSAQRVLYSACTAGNSAHAERLNLVKPIPRNKRPAMLGLIVTAIKGGATTAEAVAQVCETLTQGTTARPKGIAGVSSSHSAVSADLGDLFAPQSAE